MKNSKKYSCALEYRGEIYTVFVLVMEGDSQYQFWYKNTTTLWEVWDSDDSCFEVIDQSSGDYSGDTNPVVLLFVSY